MKQRVDSSMDKQYCETKFTLKIQLRKHLSSRFIMRLAAFFCCLLSCSIKLKKRVILFVNYSYSMPLRKVLILVGSRDSGKSKTLRKYASAETIVHRGEKSPIIVSINGKNVAIFISSTQERTPSCNVDEVGAKIKIELMKAESDNSSLMMVPFTLEFKRSGDIHERCITVPIKWLEQKYEVTVVYLRRSPIMRIRRDRTPDLDRFIVPLKDFTIKSDENYSRQANELRNIVIRIVP